MKQLPVLSKGQSWCCSNGCGICATKASLFEYSHTAHPNGDVESKAQRVFVSMCCNADLLLWDELKQDFVAWSYLEAPGTDVVTVEPSTDFIGEDMRNQIVASRPELEAVEPPNFRLPDGFNIHGLIEQCRVAARYWEPLQAYIDQFEKYMNCELCHGRCMVLEQSESDDDFPPSAEYVPCPVCNTATAQADDPVKNRIELRKTAIAAITLAGDAEYKDVQRILDGGSGESKETLQATANAFVAINKYVALAETGEEKDSMLDDLLLFFRQATKEASSDKAAHTRMFRAIGVVESLRMHY